MSLKPPRSHARTDVESGYLAREHRLRSFVLAAALAALFVAAPAGAQTPERASQLTPVSTDTLTRALRSGQIDEARYALERATSLFHLGVVRARYGEVERPDPRAATLVLRDLRLRLDELSPAEKTRARRLLARPTDGAADPDGHGYSVAEAPPVCLPDLFCIHYVATTVDAPPPGDANPADGIPDWVATAAAAVLQVWGKEIDALGYRPPLSDASSPNNGGDERLDVYLANLGDEKLYGYCTSDDPSPSFDVSAYCVIDNDFLEAIFAAHTPTENTQVTVAHEFFHAVQFAYDIGEDAWMMESTAAWIEDEVYDSINDNRQFLASSPLSHSFIPLDWGTDGFEYGSWIYFRRLSERFGVGIVRSIWDWADASSGGPDDFSLTAIAHALSSAGTSFRLAFNDFARANRRARSAYQEGAAYPPRPPARKTWTLRGSARKRSGSFTLFQLAAETIVFKPARGIGRRAKLELTLNLPSLSRGSEAAVLSFRPSGALISSRRLVLNGSGDRRLKVAFGRGRVGRVELVLMNASTRYSCWLGVPGATCQGVPLDDLLTYRYSGRAIG